MGRADLHIHSRHSDGNASVSELLDYAERHTDLDAIAITDHDTITGAVLAEQIAKEKGLRIQVIIGEEVTSKEGHIVALFIREHVTPGQSVEDTIAEIKAQGGIAIAPHPLFHTRMRSGNMPIMDGIGLISLIKHRHELDAVEVINATPGLRWQNRRARLANGMLGKPALGGSDAHIKEGVGQGFTSFEGRTLEELKAAIATNATTAEQRRWGPIALLKYGLFFIPKGTSILLYTLTHGRSRKRNQVPVRALMTDQQLMSEIEESWEEGYVGGAE